MLATVLADDLGEHDEARQVLQAAFEDGVADDTRDALLKKLDRNQPLRSRTKRRQWSPQVDDSNLVLPAADARRLLFQFESGGASADEVRAFLEGQGTDGYLAYVGERTGVLVQPRMTGFAIAFERALRAADPSPLRAMVAHARPMERALIDQAIALSEGRVVGFGEGASDLSRLSKRSRSASVARSLDSVGKGPEKAHKTMLRDIAGSLYGVGAGLGLSLAA